MAAREPEGNPEVLRRRRRRLAAKRTGALVILLAIVTAAGWGLNPVLIELAENAYGEPSAGLILESQVLGVLLVGAIILAAARAPHLAAASRPTSAAGWAGC